MFKFAADLNNRPLAQYILKTRLLVAHNQLNIPSDKLQVEVDRLIESVDGLKIIRKKNKRAPVSFPILPNLNNLVQPIPVKTGFDSLQSTSLSIREQQLHETIPIPTSESRNPEKPAEPNSSPNLQPSNYTHLIKEKRTLSGLNHSNADVVVLALISSKTNTGSMISHCLSLIRSLSRSLKSESGKIRMIKVDRTPTSLRRLNRELRCEFIRFALVVTDYHLSARTCSLVSLYEGFKISDTSSPIEKLAQVLNSPPSYMVSRVNQVVEMEIVHKDNMVLLLLHDIFSSYISISSFQIPDADNLEKSEFLSQVVNNILYSLQRKWFFISDLPQLIVTCTVRSPSLSHNLLQMGVKLLTANDTKTFTPLFKKILDAFIEKKDELNLNEWFDFTSQMIHNHNIEPCKNSICAGRSSHDIFYDSNYFLRPYEIPGQ
ncbi:hypothetical protein Ciccas_002875 [Cichlidogyrus casuarinus]|uniref:Uncharacterized protein n=1 Tax=Cichlidogyrus casuarinus TaxID=1844966 RepID=A0ABD2QGD5_9PLAT